MDLAYRITRYALPEAVGVGAIANNTRIFSPSTLSSAQEDLGLVCGRLPLGRRFSTPVNMHLNESGYEN
jgi:hypothetical protein